MRDVNHFVRRSRRTVAAILGLALVCFDPALADEPGAATETGEAQTPTAKPPDADPAVAQSDGAPNRWADAATKTFDVFPIRTLSAAAVVVGFGAFIASVPLVAPGFQMEGIRNSWDYFVVAPAEYTFVRPLGDF